MKPSIFRLFFLIILAFISLVLAVKFGSIIFSNQQLIALFTLHNPTLLVRDIIFELRIPHIICAFMTGSLLALAGALMQVLLKNPLADPYVLGVSGGAAVFNIGALLIGLGGIWLNISAGLGALLSMLIVYGIANYRLNANSANRLLLAGIVVASGWGALISLLLMISPDRTVRSLLFWLMGNLDESVFSGWMLGVLLVGFLMAMVLAPRLNILAYGEVKAKTLGVNTSILQLQLYLLSGILTAAAVSVAGCIGFVGLIVPHILRLWLGSDYRMLVPASVLLGGSLLTLADTIARTVMSPQQIPVGIIMVLLGVPVFLYLLFRSDNH